MEHHRRQHTPWRGTLWVQRQGRQRSGEELKAEVTTPAQLTAAIERATQALTQGSTSGFSMDSIVVSVSSPNVPDLTLIDLRGAASCLVARRGTRSPCLGARRGEAEGARNGRATVINTNA